MDLDKEKEKIKQLQKCQRNWDYSKPIPEEHINHFLWIAVNSPSKQWQAYYDVYYIKNRDTIKQFYEWTWGSTHSRNPPSTWRNPQMNASLYILFVAKHTVPMYNCYNDGSKAKPTDQHIWDNAFTHIGLALGLVSKAAVDLGYYVGFNKSNGMGPDYDYQWERKMGIYKDVMKDKKKLTFGIGIGHPQKDRARNEHDDYELSIGAANAHNMTLHKEGRDPIKNHKWRKTKIVDVRTANDTEVDPYGNVHKIPRVPYIKIQSHFFRDIKCIEIK
jgi:nitroreductase